MCIYVHIYFFSPSRYFTLLTNTFYFQGSLWHILKTQTFIWELFSQWFWSFIELNLYNWRIWRWSGEEKTLRLWFICIRMERVDRSRIIRIELISLLIRFNMETSPSGWTIWKLKMLENTHVKFTANRDVCFQLSLLWKSVSEYMNKNWCSFNHYISIKFVFTDFAIKQV